MPPVTRTEVKEQKKKNPPVVEVINIVEDEIDIEDEQVVNESESSQDVAVDIIAINILHTNFLMLLNYRVIIQGAVCLNSN